MSFPVVHFEIPADDVPRAIAFYKKIFGWKISDPMNMDYFICETKDQDGNGIDGGIMQRKMPGQPFTNYVFARDIDAMLPKITEAGGAIVVPKMELGKGVGWIACFKDPEGNVIGLHQPGEEMMKRMQAQLAKKKTARKAPAKKAARKAAKKAVKKTVKKVAKKKAKKKAKRR